MFTFMGRFLFIFAERMFHCRTIFTDGICVQIEKDDIHQILDQIIMIMHYY